MYCQSIKYYDSSHCIIQKKYYYSNKCYYSNKYYENKKSIIKSKKYFCCFWRAIDIKDAYYSVPVCEEDKKYLKYIFDGQLFQFSYLPNGLCSGIRKFSKLLNGPLASLREMGHVISAYIDDIFNFVMTYQQYQQNIADTINLLDSLRFIIHPDKFKFISSKEVTCLGFIINSEKITVKLTAYKKVNMFVRKIENT